MIACHNFTFDCISKRVNCDGCPDIDPIKEEPQPEQPTATLLNNLAAFADKIEAFSALLETTHAEILAEHKKTDDLLQEIKRNREARGYGS